MPVWFVVVLFAAPLAVTGACIGYILISLSRGQELFGARAGRLQLQAILVTPRRVRPAIRTFTVRPDERIVTVRG